MASRNQNCPPTRPSNQKGGAEKVIFDNRRRGRSRAPLSALTTKTDANNDSGSVDGSTECSAVEFTREQVEALLNEKPKKGNSFDYKKRMEENSDRIKQFKQCVRFLMVGKEGLVQENEKLRTNLESADKKCIDTENEMNTKIAELNETISNLKARIAREESDKLEAIACYTKEKEDRSAGEQMLASVSAELEKVREEKSAAERKAISIDDSYKRLQEVNMSQQEFIRLLQSELTTSKEAHRRLEREKPTIVENLSNLRHHNKALQDQVAFLKAEKEFSANKLNCLQEELKQIKDDRDLALAREVEKYNEYTEKSCAQLDTLTIKANSLDEMCSSQRDQINMLQQKLMMADLSASEARVVIEDQKRIIHELQEQLAEKEFQVIEGEKLRKILHNTNLELKGNIRVFCRVRPLLSDESYGTDMVVVSYPTSTEALGQGIDLIHSGQKQSFTFDKVFNEEASQKDVFFEISQLVQSALDGYKVCIFAYGQTGSGKTYTMMGRNDATELKGLIPRSLEQIFQNSQSLKDQGWKYKIQASILEICNDTIRDILSSNRSSGFDSTRTENGVAVSGKQPYTVVDVCSATEISSLLQQAAQSRSVGSTQMNEHSSRSHFVFTLHICGINERTEQEVQGVLNLIDLAGSERLSRSGATGEQLKEAQYINKSLSCLTDVIFALAKKEEHVPFRNSKLTHLLRPYLGGDSKTLMFVNISPDPSSTKESLSSLRFAANVNACQRRHTSTRSNDLRIKEKPPPQSITKKS